ncbi:glycosyl transferase family 1 [Novosphingobium sp. PC22D]|uniref:TIGR03087 family PEP-CTERM/XrtA system glycosyltransferase n=1 Tax=Novosphingobium sp. PC22D TaxID=1962403 RepID=UPI000BF0CA75|nr:TIGR03087 family PEP-CTERM/XrtA system glycosyltransferase [Novosphingobium sp. PC22D]PEQ10626.1 glycosyl transferase family 1 [Novosphingobium sp. PC22D]
MTGEVLFLSHRIPFPPDRGDKIRSHHILKHIAPHAPVHVATFADDEHDLAEEPALAELAASHCLVERTKPLALAGAEAIVARKPVSLTAFRSARLAHYVARLIATRPIATIYVFSGQMGQYVPAGYSGRVVTDFVDVDSAKFEAYAAEGSGPRAWIDAREGRLLAAEEARLAVRSKVSLLVSEAEAELFRARLPLGVSADVRAMGNGIDTAFFDPAAVSAEPAMLETAGPRLIFTGQMDYAPNIAAAERAIGAILPRVRERFADATFHVVGRNPPASLRARHGQGGAYVWGRVADIRTWIKTADLALVPLSIGRGVQNKVLEAMAMERAVVLSGEAATGIAAADGRDFRVGRDDAALADAVCALLSSPERAQDIGRAARRYILTAANWDAQLRDLPAMLGLAEGAARNAA